VLGALVALATMLKGLPMTYGKDMQEDKEPVFDAAESLMLALPATTAMIAGLTVDAAALRRATEAGFLTATDLADWLVRALGLPFRDAHHVTGRIVAAAEAENLPLDKLPLAAMQGIEPRITGDVFSVLSPESSVASRVSHGGTAPQNVLKMAQAWRKRLEKAPARG
jgi:argininosuccinate lyase